MKLISISTDKKIFDEDSDVRSRFKDYGSVFEEIHIIVFSLREEKKEKVQITTNVWAYPTNSYFKLAYVMDAFFVAKRVIKDLSGKMVVSAQDPFETGIVGWLLKKTLGIRLNIQVHTDLYSPFFRKQNFLNRIRVFVAPIIIKSADSIRVVSNRVKVSLLKYVSGEKIKVLPIFIDKDGYDQFQDVASGEDTLLAVSRLSTEKNLFFLIDVFEKIYKKRSKIKLIIVGDGPLRLRLELYIKEKGLEEQVEMVGFRKDVSEYYKGAGVFVHTSLYEGYGLVFIEAALQHIPIVSSDVGIVREVFKDEKSALICPVNDRDCFVNKILYLLDDKKKAQKITDLGYERVLNHLSYNKSQYLEEYRKII